MSEKKYDNMKHVEGALRRVYSARSSISHIDAGVLDPDEFQVVRQAVETCEQLEAMFEQRIERDRREGNYEWPPTDGTRSMLPGEVEADD
ncbi:hypothetical protein [Natronomonas marina]|uniref:hypothetical protein n=1 Tax=Natronomonas marina TaxID=2961939 RepID=UPI0020CA0346|nr:hypothetical protein [Natronomonas marina]